MNNISNFLRKSITKHNSNKSDKYLGSIARCLLIFVRKEGFVREVVEFTAHEGYNFSKCSNQHLWADWYSCSSLKTGFQLE